MGGGRYRGWAMGNTKCLWVMSSFVGGLVAGLWLVARYEGGLGALLHAYG